jgi:hypothetical protein
MLTGLGQLENTISKDGRLPFKYLHHREHPGYFVGIHQTGMKWHVLLTI